MYLVRLQNIICTTRVWDHVGTPKRLENGWFEFPDGKLIKENLMKVMSVQVNGEFDWVLSRSPIRISCRWLRVYLQTEYKLREMEGSQFLINELGRFWRVLDLL